jgi:hypothetical protein
LCFGIEPEPEHTQPLMADIYLLLPTAGIIIIPQSSIVSEVFVLTGFDATIKKLLVEAFMET